tara:strand:- start:2160 stop:2990 length:831 start_codon:yes stop_codon:yes gene_type:complete
MKKGGNSSKFNRILKDIKSIKVQGAENIARAGIKAFLLELNKKSAKKILKTRPTEPLMQNAIKFLVKSKDPKKSSEKFIKDLKKSHEMISKYGANLIKEDMNIYTHCHSSTVIDILLYAKRKQKKKFIVYTTEVKPLFQGRQTAKDLSKARIKVIISPDLAAEDSLKNCDLFLFGADAFTKNHTINKIGTSLLCKIARLHKIPRYSCGVSLKFTKKIKIEIRSPKEVWDIKIKNIKVLNPAFDKTSQKDITGIISEFGVLSPNKFIKKARKKLKDF